MKTASIEITRSQSISYLRSCITVFSNSWRWKYFSSADGHWYI